MSQEFVMGLAREAISLMLLMAAPVLLLSLGVGLTVSIFQAATQIQEPTLTFVPKIMAVFIGLLVFGSWMLNLIIQFTVTLLGDMSNIIR
ncbi:flagellar biosynthesis protein FliQ [Candidatus Contubernalis alkaliaceticus]|uniref:flagellar biosynthesis protein FliQ n=1 Tax=Candidatus Contubernalis alkaliaceticus TaxID=338645 RepID=UPI001F4C1F26|nr:flagellar biosynthesis protein FliQ [Candidatus Contubernalis alkalaceticus]UNC91758.1 flagellar biosynthesis protein FliQ [Candidatus Contubernalis alkalaceticus]